jgi:hypothetical protein
MACPESVDAPVEHFHRESWLVVLECIDNLIRYNRLFGYAGQVWYFPRGGRSMPEGAWGRLMANPEKRM